MYYILVRSPTYASKVSKILADDGIRPKCVKSPAVLNTGGCGHAVVVRGANISRVIDLLSNVGMPAFRIFQTPDGKEFNEVYRF